jgi:hypothetical protein
MLYTVNVDLRVLVLVAGKKWRNMKHLLAKLDDWVDHKVFERIRVLSVY